MIGEDVFLFTAGLVSGNKDCAHLAHKIAYYFIFKTKLENTHWFYPRFKVPLYID